MLKLKGWHKLVILFMAILVLMNIALFFGWIMGWSANPRLGGGI